MFAAPALVDTDHVTCGFQFVIPTKNPSAVDIGVSKVGTVPAANASPVADADPVE
jgi:hypothetical protein